jgi:hypothetical protein
MMHDLFCRLLFAHNANLVIGPLAIRNKGKNDNCKISSAVISVFLQWTNIRVIELSKSNIHLITRQMSQIGLLC